VYQPPNKYAMTGTRIMHRAMIANRPWILLIAVYSLFKASYLNYLIFKRIILVLLNQMDNFETVSAQIKLFMRPTIYDNRMR
jgi:hypothetical protein